MVSWENVRDQFGQEYHDAKISSGNSATCSGRSHGVSGRRIDGTPGGIILEARRRHQSAKTMIAMPRFLARQPACG